MTRFTAAALAASLLIAPAAAFAGEGSYEPFPNTAPSVVVGGPPAHDVGSQAYQGTGGQTQVMIAGNLEATGGDGHRESANSLPVGFNRGNMFYAPKESVIVARTHSPAPLVALKSAGPDTRYATRS